MRIARRYFLLQSLAGALWWVAVFASDDVRRWTLGTWSPTVLVVPDVALFVGASAIAGLTGSRLAAALCTSWTAAVTVALGVSALATREAGWGALLMVAASAGSVVAALTLWFTRLPIEWFFVGPFRFRASNDRRRATHIRRSISQLVVFWTSFLVLLPLALSWLERRLRLDLDQLDGRSWRLAGATLFLAASAFGLWSCLSMAVHGEGTPLPAATARRLVVVGPYRAVRNPMAVAGALQTIGAGLWFGSWLSVASAFAGALIWNYAIRPTEEADLLARFGEEYRAYAATVRCWIPVSAARGRCAPSPLG